MKHSKTQHELTAPDLPAYAAVPPALLVALILGVFESVLVTAEPGAKAARGRARRPATAATICDHACSSPAAAAVAAAAAA